MLKCDDYLCSKCKTIFERFWDSDYEEGGYTICKACGMPAERVYVKSSNLDRASASAWNPPDTSDARNFSDKAKYRRHLETKGIIPYEAGMDEEAKANHARHVAKQEQDFRENVVGPWFQDHTLDEIRNMIKVDKQIYDAQGRGDEAAIKAMGGITSVDEAYKQANTEPS